jgi:hypothetical protein
MLGSMMAALVLFGQAASGSGRYEVSERLKNLDQTWMNVLDKSKRTMALPKITSAVNALVASQPSEACKLLDEATAALASRPLRAQDAIAIRFDPPFVEPRTSAKLRISWAYTPSPAESVRIQVGRQSVVATPGRDLSIEVRPEQLNPDILQNPEVGYLMPVQVGSEQRTAFLSIIKKPKDRLKALKGTKQLEALGLVNFLERVFEDPSTLEADIPIIQYLFTAELLDEGRLRLDRADNLPMVSHKGTSFRAAFPRQARGPMTLVIALPGAGADESAYFETYGGGSAVSAAIRRNWAFVAPNSSPSAIGNVLDWIRTRRKQPIQRIFILGHGNGGESALISGNILPRPSAIALFAPALKSIPNSIDGIPLFVSVGKQDVLATDLRVLAPQIQRRKGSLFEEVDACEHWMIVADSIPAAYRFFDAHVGR